MRFGHFIRRFASAGGAILFCAAAISCAGEIPLVTNLFQLRQLTQTNLQSVADLDLTGIVCGSDARNNFVILQDGSATELVGMEFTNAALAAGQRVRITGEKCAVIRRRTGLGLRRLPMVDNDGQHGVREKSARGQLSAGRQPITVEWFNAGGAAALSVEFSGPGFGRRKIPDAQLSHDEFSVADDTLVTSPGLKFQSYEGLWRACRILAAGRKRGGGRVQILVWMLAWKANTSPACIPVS